MLKGNKEKGITLIALVVTIIVLLILAAVSISMLTGENGILSNAKKSVSRTKSGSILERLELALTEYQTRKHFVKEEERKAVLQEILEKIEGVESVTFDEETRKFTVVIEGETFFVDLEGNYEKINITIKVEKQKAEGGMELTIKIITKEEIEKVELIKEEIVTVLNAENNGTEYTCNKTVTEEGNYQIKVTTETSEETVNVMIDLGGPEIVHSFNTETNEISMTVTDTGSGISKIEVYQQTSETATSTITEKIAEEFSYEEAPKSKQETSKITDIPFGQYLRGYKITATDMDGNQTTVEHIFNPPIQTYIVTNEAQLKSFRDAVNNGNDFSGKTIQLGKDVELNKGKYTLDETGKIPTFNSDAEQWIPINGFRGTFDGQGYEISGVYCKSTGYSGFFGKAADGGLTIKNLGIKNSSLEVKPTSLSTHYVGGILADGGNVTSRYVIENCYYTGSINCTNISYSSGVGGIVGRSATVSRCYFDGNINCNDGNVGGIIGEGSCSDCYAKGSVRGRLSIRRNCWL